MKTILIGSCTLFAVACAQQVDGVGEDREVGSIQAAATYGSSLPDYINILDGESDGVDQSVTTEHGFEFHASLDGESAKATLINRSNARITGTVFSRVWCSDQSSPFSPFTEVSLDPLGEQVVEARCLSGTRGTLMRGAFTELSSNASSAGSVGRPTAASVYMTDAIDDGVAVAVTRADNVSVSAELRGQEAIAVATNNAGGGQMLRISATATCQTFLGEQTAPANNFIEPTSVGPGESISVSASCPAGQFIIDANAGG